MFDIGADELLVIAVVAVVVIGPKDLPRALRMAGRWIAKARRVSGHFRSGIEAMIREAELEEMEKKWREQNEAIMQAHPPEAVPAASASLPAPEVAASPPHPIASDSYDPPAAHHEEPDAPLPASRS